MAEGRGCQQQLLSWATAGRSAAVGTVPMAPWGKVIAAAAGVVAAESYQPLTLNWVPPLQLKKLPTIGIDKYSEKVLFPTAYSLLHPQNHVFNIKVVAL